MKLKIKNTIIENLTRIRSSFYNKNNNFTATGFIKYKKVKVYGLLDKNQGKLIEFINKEKSIKNFFPKLITYDSSYAVEEWIYGKTLRQIKNIKKYEIIIKTLLHKMYLIKYNIKTFDYINFLYSRIKKKKKIISEKIPLRVNHNDLSLDNIIVNTKNQLKIIDNEFLGFNNGWIFNLKNSFIKETPDFYKDFIDEKTFNEIWKIRELY